MKKALGLISILTGALSIVSATVLWLMCADDIIRFVTNAAKNIIGKRLEGILAVEDDEL